MPKDFRKTEKMNQILRWTILFPIVLSACQPAAATAQAPAVTTKPGVIPTFVLPTVTPAQPTAEPEKKLTVCLAHEPASLYPYASPTESVWSILEAVYDGPIDMVKFTTVTGHFTETSISGRWRRVHPAGNRCGR